MNKLHITIRILPVFLFYGCGGGTSDTDQHGAQIIFSDPDIRCDMNLSPDHQLMVVPVITMTHDDDGRPIKSIDRPLLIRVPSGEVIDVITSPEVEAIAVEGFIPTGTGCFSEDSQRLYFMSMRSAGVRQFERVRFVADLSAEQPTFRIVEEADCLQSGPNIPANVRVNRLSDKEIHILSTDGTLLGKHTPRGRLNPRVSVSDTDVEYGYSSFRQHPEKDLLAYSVSESSVTGFSAPGGSYFVRTAPPYMREPFFLGSIVYEMVWADDGSLYGCSSHSEHKRTIVRWPPELFSM
ncbi:MAG: hypothetical protein EA391_06070 [Balneolaceae bacterium]|nr:MAG: hypothetical protein EA391_06070 [Balneolaceae bacterium]